MSPMTVNFLTSGESPSAINFPVNSNSLRFMEAQMPPKCS
jgi:hypothetical protein